MRLAGLSVAEGAVLDARGALALVGFNYRVLAPAAFPANVRFFVVILITDEIDGDDFDGSGNGATISVRLLDLTGQPVFVLQNDVQIAPKQYPNLPSDSNTIIEVRFNAPAPGRYTLECEYAEEGREPQVKQRRLYVVDPTHM